MADKRGLFLTMLLSVQAAAGLVPREPLPMVAKQTAWGRPQPSGGSRKAGPLLKQPRKQPGKFLGENLGDCANFAAI